MDGLQHQAAKFAAAKSANVFGILYAEDFDNLTDDDHEREHLNASAKPGPPPSPPITQADVDTACTAAVEAARAEWKLADEQLRLTAVASIGPELAKICDAAEKSAIAVAELTVVTILSIITGLLPELSRKHGPAETRALLGRLLPTLQSQTRINVRVHSDLVAPLQRDIAELEPDQAALIDVTAVVMDRGDVKVSWEHGSMTRDSRKIMQAIQDALSELGLQQPVEAPSKKRMAYAD